MSTNHVLYRTSTFIVTVPEPFVTTLMVLSFTYVASAYLFTPASRKDISSLVVEVNLPVGIATEFLIHPLQTTVNNKMESLPYVLNFLPEYEVRFASDVGTETLSKSAK